MNKKLIIFIFLIFIFIIIGLVFGFLTIYRFSIVQDNYHMITTVTSADGITTTTEVFYRDDVGKIIAENGVYTWADGEYAYMIDEDKKEVYVLNINTENIGLVSYDMFATIIPGYKKSFINNLLLSGDLKNKINFSIYIIRNTN